MRHLSLTVAATNKGPFRFVLGFRESIMTTNYDEIAAEYKRAKQQPWRLHLEHFTLFKLLVYPHGRQNALCSLGPVSSAE